MKVCYITDMMGMSTRKCRVIRQLPNGNYELQTIAVVTRPEGSKYIVYGKPIFVKPERMYSIHEEKDNA